MYTLMWFELLHFCFEGGTPLLEHPVPVFSKNMFEMKQFFDSSHSLLDLFFISHFPHQKTMKSDEFWIFARNDRRKSYVSGYSYQLNTNLRLVFVFAHFFFWNSWFLSLNLVSVARKWRKMTNKHDRFVSCLPKLPRIRLLSVFKFLCPILLVPMRYFTLSSHIICPSGWKVRIFHHVISMFSTKIDLESYKFAQPELRQEF